jgi:hypothetical protein
MRFLDRRHVLTVVVALLLVLAGCQGAGGGDGAAPATGGADGGDGGNGAKEYEATAAGAGDGGDGAGDVAENRALQQRMRIRTGSIALGVDSYADARENLTRAVRHLGGYVSDSNRRTNGEDNRTWVTGRLVVRVPRGNFTTAMDRIERVGTVTESSTRTKDVTDQLVDVEARLENLRAKRDRLRDLYERANETEALLAIQERLSATQGRIERLEAQRQSLRNRVAYSTIRIGLAEPEPDTPETTPPEPWHRTGILAALEESVSGVATTLRAGVVLLAYAAPYLLTFGVPVGLAYGVYRRSRNGTNEGSEPESADDRQ